MALIGGDKRPLSFVLSLTGFQGDKSEQKSCGIAGLAVATRAREAQALVGGERRL
jgi:hypothetical protein